MYSIIRVPDEAPEQLEQFGTKSKFWFWDDAGLHCLFKEGRPNTGENWAEKVCCELCELLGLPHCHYELAVWKYHRGVLSPTFVPPDGRLILGNEPLSEFHPEFGGERRVCSQQHMVARVMAIMRGGMRLAICPLHDYMNTFIRAREAILWILGGSNIFLGPVSSA